MIDLNCIYALFVQPTYFFHKILLSIIDTFVMLLFQSLICIWLRVRLKVTNAISHLVFLPCVFWSRIVSIMNRALFPFGFQCILHYFSSPSTLQILLQTDATIKLQWFAVLSANHSFSFYSKYESKKKL